MKMHNRLAVSLFILSLASTTVAWAQTPAKPPEQLGKVSFANSCAPAAQASFERAVALLHSFWWREGERAFREVLDRDPNCAIATWGIATILIGNIFAAGPTPVQAQQAIEALERGRTMDTKTERERLFIESVAQYYERFAERGHGARMKSLSDAFESLARRFPEDDEAQIFSAIYLTAMQNPTEQTRGPVQKASGPPRRCPLPHPQLRLSSDRGEGTDRGEALR